MIKVVVVDDLPLVRKTFAEKINASSDMRVVAEFKNGKEILLAITQGLDADIIIMDIEMPVMDGIEATEKIISRYPNTKIIMCTVYDDTNNLFKAVCAGAKGYLLKDEKPEKIYRAIFETLEGGSAMSPIIAMKALNLIKQAQTPELKEEIDYNLTPREMEILNYLSAGLSYEQIADNSGIAYGTVRKHIENIYKKLNAHSKIEAINKAKKDGLI
jgi:DNA-binding NarL/FixJ family response regulator